MSHSKENMNKTARGYLPAPAASIPAVTVPAFRPDLLAAILARKDATENYLRKLDNERKRSQNLDQNGSGGGQDFPIIVRSIGQPGSEPHRTENTRRKSLEKRLTHKNRIGKMLPPINDRPERNRKNEVKENVRATSNQRKEGVSEKHYNLPKIEKGAPQYSDRVDVTVLLPPIQNKSHPLLHKRRGPSPYEQREQKDIDCASSVDSGIESDHGRSFPLLKNHGFHTVSFVDKHPKGRQVQSEETLGKLTRTGYNQFVDSSFKRSLGKKPMKRFPVHSKMRKVSVDRALDAIVDTRDQHAKRRDSITLLQRDGWRGKENSLKTRQYRSIEDEVLSTVIIPKSRVPRRLHGITLLSVSDGPQESLSSTKKEISCLRGTKLASPGEQVAGKADVVSTSHDPTTGSAVSGNESAIQNGNQTRSGDLHVDEERDNESRLKDIPKEQTDNLKKNKEEKPSPRKIIQPHVVLPSIREETSVSSVGGDPNGKLNLDNGIPNKDATTKIQEDGNNNVAIIDNGEKKTNDTSGQERQSDDTDATAVDCVSEEDIARPKQSGTFLAVPQQHASSTGILTLVKDGKRFESEQKDIPDIRLTSATPLPPSRKNSME
ncbi:uncharacterized protein LOC106155570 isoform X1 [Lingula anatina]|uniref:Uncharacterized protein LOC106155570 isoform X1 n=2 Tax=Lingula anatina TaxID=7574 RepID=A0A1S3HKC3_LINAN|nr:uncharacterized protein LOC106155570 isoform X1 [Lingula anatina]|eukprot:XP_013385911.1 uncharacterized protein LOC106155570 isoform X1 [Lingula anatina]